ncbi:MAG: histidine phosphatase family protein, partial [Brachybacterium sp.]|nr:histidine phosphatase family protein [Brachybacterium sp.]
MNSDIWVLRHGESTANVEGLIVSVPGPRALAEVGLTPRGREQARQAGRGAIDQGLGADTLVISSDFARARQTAEEFAGVLGAREPRLDPRLRERCFGNHDE